MIEQKAQIFIFRHGETDWNKELRLQGHTNTQLNSAGKTQALALKEFFSSNPVEHIYSSDLLRAAQTAEIAASGAGISISHHEELRECFLGSAEGLTKQEVVDRFGQELWDKWTHTDVLSRDVRLPSGESTFELLSRINFFIRNLKLAPSSKIAISTHGLVVKRLLHSIATHIKEPIPIPNCVLYELSYCARDERVDLVTKI